MAKRFEKPNTPEYVARKRAVGSVELEIIRVQLSVSRAALSRIYQVSQPDFHRMLEGKISLPERCAPTHRALYLLATGATSDFEA